jgi:anti-anti-sigma regulatory factor
MPDRGETTTPRVPAGHTLLLFSSEEHRWQSIADWTLTGLDLGEKVIFSGLHLRGWHDLTRRLGRSGRDVDDLVSTGQLQFASLHDLFPDDGQEAVVTGALAEGYPGVRLSWPAIEALTRLDHEGYARVEAQIDEMCRRLPLSALCQYDADDVRDDVAAALISHPIVADGPGLIETRLVDADGEGPHVVADLVGEFDSGNAGVLEEALLRMGRVHGPVARMELDLTGLRFLSVAAGRALLEGTWAFRADGGLVSLRGASRHLNQVLVLLSLADHEGIELERGGP